MARPMSAQERSSIQRGDGKGESKVAVRRVDREKAVSRKEVEEPKLGEGKDKRKWNGEVRSELRCGLNC
jgi:hypothetical protein